MNNGIGCLTRGIWIHIGCPNPLFLDEIIITFENFHIYRPQIHENNGKIKLMFPQEARLRNLTYASAMSINIIIKYIIRNG